METTMRKNALLAALITFSAASNAAAVQFYGKANVSINHTDASNSDTLKLNSNASRIGVKGSYEVSEGLKAIYKFEYETFIDDGDDGSGDSGGGYWDRMTTSGSRTSKSSK